MSSRYTSLWLGVSVAFLLIATTALAQDQLDDARRKLEQASAAMEAKNAAQAANDMQAVKERGQQYIDLLGEARELYIEYIEIHPEGADDPVVLREYAALLERTNDPDLAASVLKQLTSLTPQDAWAWVRLGNALSLLGDDQVLESKNAYERALTVEAEPELRAQAYAGLGRLYFDLELYALAEETLVEVLQLDSQDIETLIILASLHIRRGDVIVAADTLDSMGGALAPHSVLLQEYLVKALSDFDLNRVWFPDNAAFHLAYAKLVYRAGRLSEAASVLERSLELNDENHVSWNLLGSFRNQVGDIEGAKEAFTRSLALNPEQPRTQKILEVLTNPPG